MEQTFSTLLDYVTGQAWAMDAGVLEQMAAIVNRHLQGVRLSQAEIEAATAKKTAAPERSYQVTADGRALIPVGGLIAKHARMVNGVSQPRGTSLEMLRGQLREALADAQVKSIFLHIESPGGSATGLADFADELYQAGAEKPVVAFADDLAASAAYWLGAQANAFYGSRRAYVGSIGVYSLVVDSSAWAENEGLKVHILRTGDHKGVGAPGVKIEQEQLDVLQEQVNETFEDFLRGVLRGRAGALDEETLRKLADGRTYAAAAAQRRGLLDAVMTLEEALLAPLPSTRTRPAQPTRPARQNLKTPTGEKLKNEDENQAAAALAEDRVDNSLSERNQPMSDEKQKEAQATVDMNAAAQATALERQRITQISEALAAEEFAEVRNRAIAGGLTLTEAKAEAFAVCQKRRAEEAAAAAEQLQLAQQKLDAIAKGTAGHITAPAAPDGEEATAQAGDDGSAANYLAAVEKYQAQGKSRAESYRLAAIRLPRCHAAWKEAQAQVR